MYEVVGGHSLTAQALTTPSPLCRPRQMVAFLLSSMRTLVRRGVPTVAFVLLKSETARCDGPTTSSGSAGRVFEDGLSNLSSPEDSAGDLEPASGLFGTRVPLAALVSVRLPAAYPQLL